MHFQMSTKKIVSILERFKKSRVPSVLSFEESILKISTTLQEVNTSHSENVIRVT